MTGRRGVLPTREPGRSVFVALSLLPLLGSLMAGGLSPAALSPPLPMQMPEPDRLAQPLLPESPTQVDTGRYLYYFHCMPCHGDRGQGLTDEWREVWIEDHQNCWGRGCHTGRSDMDAFFLPRFVPPVIGLRAFATADDLFVFLRGTQPPQRPGALTDTEYWALTAFLLHENDRLAPGVQIGLATAGTVPPVEQEPSGSEVILATLLALLPLLLVRWLGKRQKVS